MHEPGRISGAQMGWDGSDILQNKSWGQILAAWPGSLLSLLQHKTLM